MEPSRPEDGYEQSTRTRDGPPAALRLPERIGRYHVKRVIASGGMGTVYEATQESPRRVVALKVMKQGIASRSALRRFEYEGQILARLRHPGIAQIFEAGMHVDKEGLLGPAGATAPYFAMEYIPNAKPITRYVEDKKLGTRERLQLFAQVCDAVHHGHQKGIIHRDLKPSNILVTSDPTAAPLAKGGQGGLGQVKIIDFGVARSTDSDMAVTTLQTDVGQLLGTLQYMSPEQCEADPHDIDTRSDVYALGVVFYELLCGKLPYDLTGVPMHHATRVIREQDPTKLSTRDRALRGDVETIALKALEKDRTRRYQSAAEFAQDIERYLSNRPILARPPSPVYQLRVFARRNRALCTAAAVVFLALASASVISTSMYLRAESARLEQSRERQRAEQARDEAQAVTEFLSNMLAQADPWKSGKDILVRQVVDEASKTVGTKFTDQPLVEARLRATMGETYDALGLYEEAEPHLKGALEIHRHRLGPEHPETIRSKLRLGFFNLGRGTLTDAKSICDQALPEARRSLGAEHEITLQFVHLQDSLAQQEGRYGEALTLAQRVLDVRRRVLGDEHPETLQAMHRVAGVYLALGRPADAAEMDERVVAVRRRLLGDEHPDTVDSMGTLADSYHALSRFEDAARLHEDVLAVRRRELGDDHVYTWRSMVQLAKDYVNLGRCPEAFRLYEQGIERFRGTFGDGYWDTLSTMNEYAWFLLSCRPPEFRDPQAAQRTAETVCSIAERTRPSVLYQFLDTLALAQHMTGDTAAAVKTQQRALVLAPSDLSEQRRRGFEDRLAAYQAALPERTIAGSPPE
jgi:serine/threonine protein kinase